MIILLVPNHVSEAINARLDAALALWPEAAECRVRLYHQLLEHFNEHGEIPEFSIIKKEPMTERTCRGCGQPFKPESDGQHSCDGCYGTLEDRASDDRNERREREKAQEERLKEP